MTLVDSIRDRRPVNDHDGRSGARIETGTLADGTRVYLKHADLDRDLGALLSGNGHRERDLLEAGVFDRLPPAVATALVAIDEVDGQLVTVTRDLGAAIFSWDRVLTPAEVRAAFEAIASMHRRYAGDDLPALLCPLELRASLFSPDRLDVVGVANPELAAAARRGWERFADLVPTAVADAVDRSLRHSGPFVAALAASGTTLLHGDFWFVNIALEDDCLVLLDWGLATAGPPALDFIMFCIGGMSNVAMSREEFRAEARAACGGNDDTFALAQFWALMELGWNKALDAVDHPDPVKRATERADLDFWVARALVALDAGLVP